MKTICDTNVWYGVGNRTIDLSSKNIPKPYVTNLNIDEFARTPNILDDSEAVRDAIRSAMNYKVIIENPYVYLLKLDNQDIGKALAHDKYILEGTEAFAHDRVIKKEFREEIRKEWIEPRQKELKEIADLFNERFGTIRSGLKEGKKEFRKLDHLPFVKDWTNYLVRNWTYTHLGNEMSLSDSFDWKQVDLFVRTCTAFYVELSVSNQKYQPNDSYDLHNLIYVSPGDKYWTKEKRWLRIIKDLAKQGDYLVE